MVNLVNSEKYIIKSEIFKVSYYASELFIDIVYWISLLGAIRFIRERVVECFTAKFHIAPLRLFPLFIHSRSK